MRRRLVKIGATFCNNNSTAREALILSRVGVNCFDYRMKLLRLREGNVLKSDNELPARQLLYCIVKILSPPPIFLKRFRNCSSALTMFPNSVSRRLNRIRCDEKLAESLRNLVTIHSSPMSRVFCLSNSPPPFCRHNLLSDVAITEELISILNAFD